mgnify:CR=1 FL=1
MKFLDEVPGREHGDLRSAEPTQVFDRAADILVMQSQIPKDQPHLVIKYEYITPGADTIVGEQFIPMPACGLHPRQAGAAAMRLTSAFKVIEMMMRLPHSVHDFVDHEWTLDQGRMLTLARKNGVSPTDFAFLVQAVKDGHAEEAAMQRLAEKNA